MHKKIVVPGELVTEDRKKTGAHVFVREGKIFASTVGIVSVSEEYASVIPLQGKYMPKPNDLIVGIVGAEAHAGYIVDINSFYRSFLSKKETSKTLRKGDVISAKITEVNEINEVSLNDVRVFYGGEVLSVSPVKVPRMLGRQGSMLGVLKEGTGCSLMIGRNGWVWVKGGNIPLLKFALKKIIKWLIG